jgi:ubiquitin-protein ligase
MIFFRFPRKVIFDSHVKNISDSGNPQNKRLFNELRSIQEWESEKKFILDFFSSFDADNSSMRSNNTRPTQHSFRVDRPVIRGRILPEKDPYCFASFLIEIRLPFEYPFMMPELIILDQIYHPVVRHDGTHRYCWGLSAGLGWRPTMPLVDCIKAVISTIDNPDLAHGEGEIINEYRNNYKKFYEKALEYTLKYGRPRC